MNSGFVLPRYEAEENAETWADYLAHHFAGGLAMFNVNDRTYHFLVWPTGTTAWENVETHLPTVPHGSLLRFMSLYELPELVAETYLGLHILETTAPQTPEAMMTDDSENETDELVVKCRSRAAPNNINFAMSFEVGGLYEQMSSPNDLSVNRRFSDFFLYFLPTAVEFWMESEIDQEHLKRRLSEEHDLVLSLLQSKGANTYSMQGRNSLEISQAGHWDYFRHNVKYGCIIVCISFYSLDYHTDRPSAACGISPR